MGLVLTPPATADSADAYGPSEKMSGVYFTNFENSVFTECSGEQECRNWASKDGSWVNCTPEACRDLEARTTKLNGSPAKWGTFSITFVGRQAKERHAKRFLNDRESTVQIERILDFQLIEGEKPN